MYVHLDKEQTLLTVLLRAHADNMVPLVRNMYNSRIPSNNYAPIQLFQVYLFPVQLHVFQVYLFSVQLHVFQVYLLDKSP